MLFRSSDYYLSQNQGAAFSTTSSDFWINQYGKGFFFATSSADYWKSVNNFFSTTSANAWDLTKVWPKAKLEITPASGHSAFEAENVDALVRATDSFA